MKNTIWVLLFIFVCGFSFAQQKTHVVQPKETVYGISKLYNVSQGELKKANPFLNERGLQIGDELVIPNGKAGDGQITANVTILDQGDFSNQANHFRYIEIQPKQTIYSLTKEYGISEDALVSLNPQLVDGLKAGDIIRLPKVENSSSVAPDGMYLVKRGDTVFSLSKQFGVSEDEFYIANPLVQTRGIKVGTYLNIPQKGKGNAVFQDGFIEHTVKQGETVFSLCKLYKISFADLLKNNPELNDGLKTGMKLKIPLADDANIQISGKIKRINDGEINIAMILPFHVNSELSKPKEKEISVDILIGAKMALDSLVHQGKKINLKIFDSENRASSVENLVVSENFSKFDAVIGPLFGSTFKSFAQMMAGSGIALVSPLSNSNDLTELENVLVATPTDQSIADAIVEEVKTNYAGEIIQVLTDDRNEELSQYFIAELKKKISGAEIVLTKDATKLVQNSESVDETLSDGTVVKKQYFTPIITVLVSDNNALGDAYVTRIKEMDPENLKAFGVKFVSAYDLYNSKNKKNIAALKNIGFTFSTVHLVNIYGAGERKTLEKFMDTYCLTPNEYQQIGYDIMYDLVDRMSSSGDVLSSLSTEKTRLSTKFRYEKEGKAYINKSVRTVRLFVKPDESPDDDQDLKD